MPSVNPSIPAQHSDDGLQANAVIIGLDVRDIRFPTSRELDGSDAMNPRPDYSAAYLTLQTSSGHAGYSLVFTIGRGNDVQAASIKALEPLVIGVPLADVLRPGSRRLLPPPRVRQPDAMARPGKRRRAYGRRGRGERSLGS